MARMVVSSAYESSSGIGPVCWPEVNQTMRPPGRSSSGCAAKRCANRSGARTLTAMDRSISAAAPSGATVPRIGFATRMSTCPKQAEAASKTVNAAAGYEVRLHLVDATRRLGVVRRPVVAQDRGSCGSH